VLQTVRPCHAHGLPAFVTAQAAHLDLSRFVQKYNFSAQRTDAMRTLQLGVSLLEVSQREKVRKASPWFAIRRSSGNGHAAAGNLRKARARACATGSYTPSQTRTPAPGDDSKTARRWRHAGIVGMDTQWISHREYARVYKKTQGLLRVATFASLWL
jgi:hypothetical protein